MIGSARTWAWMRPSGCPWAGRLSTRAGYLRAGHPQGAELAWPQDGALSHADGRVLMPEVLQELAESQRGVITRRQALGAGLTRSAICARVDGRRWQRMYPGVFAAFSGEPSRAALLWAAVLKAGPGAALSHETAAELHGLTRKPAPLIHVTVPARRRVEPAPRSSCTDRHGSLKRAIRARYRRAPGSRRQCWTLRTQLGLSRKPSAGRAPHAAVG